MVLMDLVAGTLDRTQWRQNYAQDSAERTGTEGTVITERLLFHSYVCQLACDDSKAWLNWTTD
jgi:hypothetical protein